MSTDVHRSSLLYIPQTTKAMCNALLDHIVVRVPIKTRTVLRQYISLPKARKFVSTRFSQDSVETPREEGRVASRDGGVSVGSRASLLECQPFIVGSEITQMHLR